MAVHLRTPTIDDPRCQPGCYVHNGCALYLVLSVKRSTMGPGNEVLTLENAYTGAETPVNAKQIENQFKLAREAPHCPDALVA